MSGFIDFAAEKNCYATLWSYGQICVGCGCCSKDMEERRKARLEYWQWLLDDNLNFDRWADGHPDLIEIQKRNVKLNIKKAKGMVKYYSR